jgi:ABC-type oligopeptide transport system ATPase subunit
VNARVAESGPAPGPAVSPDPEVLLRVRGLRKTFGGKRRGLFGRRRAVVHAVNDISFEVRRGQTLGLVGESGSGKSTAASCVLRLQEPDAGSVALGGVDVLAQSRSALRELRSRMQMVFQDPYGSLDPRFSVLKLVEEPLLVHGVRDPDERRTRALETLDRVGLSAEQAERNAHAFSGGQRQRIAIARALVLNPDLVVLDEPVTALDVSVQAQVLNLLVDLQRDLGLTYLFIVHDLAVAQYACHRIAVMQWGRIVEMADSDELFDHPAHPYTRSLLLAAPVPDPDAMKTMRAALREQLHLPAAGEAGSVGATPVATEGEPAPLREISPGHWAAV